MRANAASNIASLTAITAFCAAMFLSLLSGMEPFVAFRRSGIGGLLVGAVVWTTLNVSFALCRDGRVNDNEEKDKR